MSKIDIGKVHREEKQKQINYVLPEYLKKDTANTPYIHFVVVISICEETFRRPIPELDKNLFQSTLTEQKDIITQKCL